MHDISGTDASGEFASLEMGKVRVRSGLDRLGEDAGLWIDVGAQEASFRAGGSRRAAAFGRTGLQGLSRRFSGCYGLGRS